MTKLSDRIGYRKDDLLYGERELTLRLPNMQTVAGCSAGLLLSFFPAAVCPSRLAPV